MSKENVRIDIEMAHRYDSTKAQAEVILRDTALLGGSTEITNTDIGRILSLYTIFDPVRTGWRINGQRENVVFNDESQLKDGSRYSNWNEAGGPMEHINLSVLSVSIILEILKENLRIDIAPQLRAQFESLNPQLLEAIMAFHDIGRLFTHTFFTNGVIGDRLIKALEIRSDILQNLPAENVMLTPLDKDMVTVIENLGVIAVIARLADEFGKRSPGTNRLYTPNDYDKWDRESWANGYINKPVTGRPSDRFFRKNVQLHKNNVPRYFAALDTWVQKVSTLNLDELVKKLQERIGELPPLPEQK